MNWLIATITGLLTGVVGLFSVGFLANLCVGWYRVSGREGAAGYFVIFLALLGGIVSVVLGLVSTYFFAPDHTGLGFLKNLGCSTGVVVGLTGIATALCWLLADIPPTVDGRELSLEVEFRLPTGEKPPAVSTETPATLWIARVTNHRRANSWPGKLEVSNAVQTDGRWVIPGSAFLFTRRNRRVIEIGLPGRDSEGFVLSLPANPGKRFTEWSDWLPRQMGKGQPWPATKLSYRFRVRPIEPPPPEPTEAELATKKFAELKPDAPLESWLEFLNDNVAERGTAALNAVQTRQAELATLIRSSNSAHREQALSAVSLLPDPSAEIVEAVLAEGRAIASGIRTFNEMKLEDPEFYNVQIDLRTRFNYWKQAWWDVHRIKHLDGRPPLQEIFDLASIRAKDTTMDEIVLNARVILEVLNPPAPATVP